MLGTYFTNLQVIVIAFFLLAYIGSIISFEYGSNSNRALLILLLATFTVKVFALSLDPFLNLWDEQMHALVAKNLSKNFLKPTLFPKDILPYDYRNWVGNYIWVHKQPLYLWQMALFIKVFGASVYAMRMPSAICFTFCVFCVYRIGINFFSKRTAFYGAFLFSACYYFNELTAGAIATDHNDVVFTTYVTASLWALSEHLKNPASRKWIIMIGVFAGLSVLTKWLVGLLVFSGWFFYLIMEDPKGIFQFKKYKALLLSFIISIIVFLPWQLFIFSAYPREAAFEFEFAAKHFSEALEGHTGNRWFYYDNISRVWGRVALVFFLPGLILLYRYSQKRIFYFTALFYIILVFSFFTVAATKMPGFVLIVSSFVFLGFGAIAETFYNFLSAERYKILKAGFVAAVFTSGVLSIDIELLQQKHTFWKKDLFLYYNRKYQTEWKETSENLKNYLPDDNYLVFNCGAYNEIKLMFYSDYLGYYGLPNKEQINIAKQKGYKIAILDNGNLPPEITSNKDYLIIQTPAYKPVKIDTVFIRSKLHFYVGTEPDSKLSCNVPDRKQSFVIKTFADSTSQIRLLNGPMAKVYFELGGVTVCNSNEYTFTERFKLEKFSDIFTRIKTEDGTPLNVFNNGERLVAKHHDELNAQLFEIIPLKRLQ
jgi:hypothetical protein